VGAWHGRIDAGGALPVSPSTFVEEKLRVLWLCSTSLPYQCQTYPTAAGYSQDCKGFVAQSNRRQIVAVTQAPTSLDYPCVATCPCMLMYSLGYKRANYVQLVVLNIRFSTLRYRCMYDNLSALCELGRQERLVIVQWERSQAVKRTGFSI
jgi:hypothetical protein